MDTSSEDSFAWTNTSNDDSCAEPMLAYEEESDFGKSFKKKLQKELFQNGDHEEPGEETPRARKKKVKREPSSSPAGDSGAGDSGAGRSPRRPVKHEAGRQRRRSPAGDSDAVEHEAGRQRCCSSAGDSDVGRALHGRVKCEAGRREPAASPPADDQAKAREDRSPEPHVNGDIADAERFLRLKVKQERAGPPASDAALKSEEAASRKKKKAKRRRSPEPAVDGEPADAEEPPPKKKKKKHKRGSLDETPVALVEKFEAAETVVEERRPSPARAPPSPASPRALKIRERITFEEDSVDRAEPESEEERGSPAPAPGAAPAGRLARYLRAHAGLRALEAGAGAGAGGGAGAALGPDDDVWLLRAPRSLRPAALQGAALPLGRGRLKAGGRGYDVAPADGGARAALLLAGGGWRVRGVRLCGGLALRVRVPRARAAPACASPPPAAAPPPPPPAPRARHPLLGADFERALAPRPRPRRPIVDDDSRDVENTKKKKKKKKRERERREAEAEPAPEGPEPGPDTGPRRRAPERWDSERAIEESLFGA